MAGPNPDTDLDRRRARHDRMVQRALDPPATEGDPQGIGPTLGPDVSVEHERREIERGVFRRRADKTGQPRTVEDQAPGDDR